MDLFTLPLIYWFKLPFYKKTYCNLQNEYARTLKTKDELKSFTFVTRQWKIYKVSVTNFSAHVQIDLQWCFTLDALLFVRVQGG